MFWPSETEFEEIRRRQRELREQAARARLIARARREATPAAPAASRRGNWFARRIRAGLARP